MGVGVGLVKRLLGYLSRKGRTLAEAVQTRTVRRPVRYVEQSDTRKHPLQGRRMQFGASNGSLSCNWSKISIVLAETWEYLHTFFLLHMSMYPIRELCEVMQATTQLHDLRS